MTTTGHETGNARHYDGMSPDPRPARVRLDPGALTVEREGGTSRRWPLERVRVVSSDRSGTQLELLGDPVEALIVSDPAFAAALREANGGRQLGNLGGGPPAIRILAVLAVAFVVLLFAAWRWGVPALAGVAADQVPPEWERRFGAMVVEAAAPEALRLTDERVVAPVREVFDPLVAEQASRRDSFQVIVMREKAVNAFAAPGGCVVVTTGLLGALRGPDELAAVLAHEISHVARRHTTRGLFARLGVTALFSLIAGDPSGLGPVMSAAGRLGALSYSRADEADADAGAVQLLARAGVDPAALGLALESIAAGSAGPTPAALSFLSTHPSTVERRERVRELAAGVRVGPAARLPGEAAWSAMRAALPKADAKAP